MYKNSHQIVGIQFWAITYCRSTFALYKAIADSLNIPFRVCVNQHTLGQRSSLGYTIDEFKDIEIVITPNPMSVVEALIEKITWFQVFGAYHKKSYFSPAINLTIKRNIKFGIFSESPCNMESSSIFRFLKFLYFRSILRSKVRNIKDKAVFIANLSGNSSKELIQLGWDPTKILPSGYYPPPLLNSTFVPRLSVKRRKFRILCTGNLSWHRGADVFVEALVLFHRWNVPYEAYITGEGPLLKKLQSKSVQNGLNLSFLGLVPISELIAQYQKCSVFVAPGRHEPWGIRVNDALNSGAPVLVSRGMGSSMLVDDFSLGLTFLNEDPIDLAWKLKRLATDFEFYQSICKKLDFNRGHIHPISAGQRLTSYLLNLNFH